MLERKISKEKHPLIIRLYEQGLSKAEIARQFNLDSDSIIKKILKENNIKSRGQKKYSEEEEIKIVKAYQDGCDTVKLTEMFDISIQTVRNIMKRHNVRMRAASEIKRNESLKHDKEMIRMYQEGYSSVEIGKTLGVSYTTVLSVLKERRIKKRKSGKKTIPFTWKDKDKIITQYKNGMSVLNISKFFKVGRERIEEVLKENHTPKRDITEYNRKVPKEQEKKIAKLYTEKVPVKELAEKYMVDTTTVRKVLRRQNVKLKTIKDLRKFTEKEEKEIIKEYKKGITIDTLSKRYSCQKRTITSVLKRNNITIRNIQYQKKQFQAKEDEIINLYKQGIRTRKIAVMLDVSYNKLLELLKNKNLLKK